MALSILQMTLPVLVVIALGFAARRFHWFSTEGLAGLKAVVGKITLPAVLFNAFLTAEYTLVTLVTFLTVYAALGIALALGFRLRRLNPRYGKFMPFLLTGFEGGMMGYALFGLLYGSSQTHVFAMADVGQTFFAFTTFLCALQMVNGQKPTPGAVTKNMLTNPAFVGMSAGLVLGVLGVGKWLLASAAGPVVTSLLSFLTGPTAVLILLTVGYELSFHKEILKPVLLTVGLRFAIMAGLCALCSLVIFSLTPFQKPLQAALLLGFSLPAPFIIPLYADVKGHGEYISTTLSLSTLLSVALFAVIAAYCLA